MSLIHSFIYQLKIGRVQFEISIDHEISITKAFAPFLIKDITDAYPKWIVHCCKGKKKDLQIENTVYTGIEYDVLIDSFGKDIVCYKNLKENSEYYAYVTLEPCSKKVCITYLEGKEYFFSETGNTFFHTRWEKIMMQERRIIMHASCIDSEYGGILFTGKSGIGKSTQSNLWIQHENAELINGDRPILMKVIDSWKAFGSPYAGSSGCHKNKASIIKAIVLLDQSPTCTIRQLGIVEAFKLLYPMMIIQQWDTVFVQKVCDLTMELVSEVPVYHMSCTPDQKAVECLKYAIEGE